LVRINTVRKVVSYSHRVVPEKIHTPPTEDISAVRRGRGGKIVSEIINVLGHPKGVGGLSQLSNRLGNTG
jgi:hypothetical protein